MAAAYFPRNVDAGLHEIAHQRVAEARACNCLDHDRMRAGTAEVLAWNQGAVNPITAAVAMWAGSSVHHGILSSRSYGRIGCAEALDGSTHWFACVLAAGPLPAGATAAAPAPAAPVSVLPDTAMMPRSLGSTRAGGEAIPD